MLVEVNEKDAEQRNLVRTAMTLNAHMNAPCHDFPTPPHTLVIS